MESEEREPGILGFGALLRRYRLAAGLTQEALAERARMSLAGIGALERGYRRTPQRETLELLARALALDNDGRRIFEAAAVRPSLPRMREGASVTVGPWPNAGTANLPLSLTPFIGRRTELDEIAALVKSHRLVTITGAGGIGKTQTALRVATDASDAAESALYFVGFASIGDPSLVATAIASALAVQEVPNHPLLETLTAFLRNKASLLVLDNCEHVIAQAATVVDTLLRACPNLRILATSRERLRTAGERGYRLPSLEEGDAVVLFADRAQAADAHFVLTDQNKPIVSEICTQLGGIPLAIELAAARVAVLQLPLLAKALTDRFGVLVRGERTAPSRHNTMLAAIDWSYQLLTLAEQQLFERLSIFAGGSTLAAAAAVCSGDSVTETEVSEQLLSLVDKSMVTVDLAAHEPRYGLLAPFQQYARDKLTVRGEQNALALRHARACLSLAQEIEAAWDAQPDRDWVESARSEMDNWRRALEFSLTRRSDILLGQTLVAALVHVWSHLVPTEGRRWANLARDLVGEDTPAKIAAGLRCVDFVIANHFQEYERELCASSDALELYKGLGDEFGMVWAETHLVRALVRLGRIEDVEDAITAVLARARSLRLHKRLNTALRVAAMVSMRKGELLNARTQLGEADAIARACGAERELASGGLDWAACEFLGGNAERALEYATASLRYARAAGNIALTNFCLFNISEFLLSLARFEAAEEYAREALTIASDQGADGVALLALQRLVLITAVRLLSVPKDEPMDRVRAARILGFISRRVSTTEASIGLKQEYYRSRDLLQESMGGDTLEKLMSEGAALTQDQVVRQLVQSRNAPD